MTTTIDRQQLLAERRRRIGSSDIAAIMGLSRYGTPASVYQRLVDPAPRDEPGPESPLWWGSQHEPIIREAYRQKQIAAGMPLDLLIRDGRTYFSSRPWEVAHTDSEIPGAPPRIGEIKSDNDRPRPDGYEWGREGTGDVPPDYIAQVMWQVGVANEAREAEGLDAYRESEVIVLLRGNDFRVYEVEPHDELVGICREQGERFWRDHVEPRNPPPMAERDDAKILYRQSSDLRVTLSQADADSIRRRQELKRAIKAAEQEIEQIEMRVGERMRNAAEAVGPLGDVIVRWKTQTAKVVDLATLRQAHPDVYAACLTERVSRPFTVVKRAVEAMEVTQ